MHPGPSLLGFCVLQISFRLQAGNPAVTSGKPSLQTNSASSQTSPHPWSGAPGLKRLVARSCLGLGLCLGPAVVGPGMESPWFLVDRVRGHAGAARIVYGPPDKIWSLRAWSPQMVWMPLTPRAMTHPYYIAAYEVWHNKVQTEDPFGKMTSRLPETLASVCGGPGLEWPGARGERSVRGFRRPRPGFWKSGGRLFRESFRIKSRTRCCLW